jgi:MFS family permease
MPDTSRRFRRPAPGSRPGPAARLAVLRERDFRRFFLGYATSLLGSSMASVAVTFAVLGAGGGGTEVGAVLAARTLPLVLVLLVGGVVSDRLGSRRVMLTADAVRCLTQAGLAAVLFARAPALWTLIALVALWGAAEALFTPALGALVPGITRDAVLSDANALLGMVRSGASIVGPVLAGLLTAAVGAAVVLALDAASYAASVVALLLLPRAAPPAARTASFAAELREGWTEFRSRTWVWVTSVHYCLFNFVVWAPFLVLGPVLAQRRLGGASAWGVVMAVYGAGAVAGGLALLGRRPRRPVFTATAASLGFALPPAALAAGRSLPWICAGAFAAGVGAAVSGALSTTAIQRQVPREALARVSAYESFGAFVLGPAGLAAAGPLAALAGAPRVLALGAAWQVAAVAVVLAVPAVRGADRGGAADPADGPESPPPAPAAGVPDPAAPAPAPGAPDPAAPAPAPAPDAPAPAAPAPAAGAPAPAAPAPAPDAPAPAAPDPAPGVPDPAAPAPARAPGADRGPRARRAASWRR